MDIDVSSRFCFRDYDTYTSRWTAPDPIGDAGGDSDWYGYCLDDPVNGVDPLGLFGSAIANGVAGMLQYAPALNRVGIVVADQFMDGRPGPVDLYFDMVRENVDTLKRTRKKYYENLEEKKGKPKDEKDSFGYGR